MNRLYRHSPSCTLRCLPQGNQDLYSHEDDLNIEHQYIREKRIEDQLKHFKNGVEKICLSLVKYKDGLLEQLGRIKKQIENFQGEIGDRVSQFLESIKVDIIEQQSNDKIAKAINHYSFQSISCCQMDKLLNLTSPSYSKHLGAKVEEKVFKMQKECQIFFQKFAKITFRVQKYQLVNMNEIELLNIVKLEQSTILKNQNSNEISINGLSDFNLLSFDTKAEDKIKKNDKKMENDDQDEIVEQSDQDTYFNKTNQKTTTPTITKMPSNKDYSKQEKEKIEQSKYTQQSWLCHYEQSKNEVFPIQQQQNKSQKSNYMKINELDQKINSINDYGQYRFNIKIEIVRLLYYFKIREYLKVKFIGGDQTGVAVFITNYQKGLKAGDQLEMYDCQLFQFKKSVEIKNDRDFQIMEKQKEQVKANIKGIFLNEYIEEGIYYALNDRKCSLIRNIADCVRRKGTLNIEKVIVKISYILNQWNSHIFCQVGDSSGLMLAYIKKTLNQKIKEGDVLNIQKLKGKKGKDPSGLIEEQILYLDAIGEKTLVKTYLNDFLQISQNVMSL